MNPMQSALLDASPTASFAIDTSDTLEQRLAAARPRLLRLARLFAIPHEAADDIAQDTMLAAWRAVATLRDPERFDSWLDGICRNMCRRYLRSSATHVAHAQPLPTDEQIGVEGLDESAAETILDELAREEQVVLLDRAMTRLSPAARQAVAACYLAERPAAEVAPSLGLSVNALEVRLTRARRHLRAIFDGPLRAEAETLGLVAPRSTPTAPRHETRVWCPLCGARRLVATIDRATGDAHFLCLRCASREQEHIVGSRQPALVANVKSYKALLTRQLMALTTYYHRGLAKEPLPCVWCGGEARLHTHTPAEVPDALPARYGLHIICSSCGLTDVTDLGRFTLDLPATQRFWRAHPRIHILPEREITWACQPALLTLVMSVASQARLEVIYAPDRFTVLATQSVA